MAHGRSTNNVTEEASLSDTVRQNSELLEKLKSLPLLVEQLSNRFGQGEGHFPVYMQADDHEEYPGDQNSDYVDLIDGIRNNESHECDNEDVETDAILSEILKDVEKGIDFGPPIDQHIADSFLKTISRPLTKETATKLKQAVKIPANCKLLQPPKMNGDIWKCLPSHARIEDLKKQQMQSSLCSGISAMSQIASTLANYMKVMPQNVSTELLKLTMDTSNVLGDQFQDLNVRRRYDVKRYINAQYGGICSNEFPAGEYLFGNDLSEALKASKASAVLPRQGYVGNRFQPYSQRNQGFKRPGSFRQPLNFNLPPGQAPRRGSWNNQQQRGLPYNRNYRSPAPFQKHQRRMQ